MGYNLVTMLSKEVLMANMRWSVEYATVYCQKELFSIVNVHCPHEL